MERSKVGYVVTSYDPRGRQCWLVERAGGDGFFWSTQNRHACVFEEEDDAKRAGAFMYAKKEDYYFVAKKLLSA